MRITSLAVGALLTLVAMAVALPPDAEARRWKDRAGYGYVTADSRYGGPSVTAPVRVGAQGRPQVQLPGGTWIECHWSCSETLRRQTVDFWHIQSDPFGGGTDGVGYLHFRF